MSTDTVNDRGAIIRRRYFEKEFEVGGEDWGLDRWWKHETAQVYRLYSNRIVGRVLEVGFGVGAVSLLVARDPAVTCVLGLDVAYRALEIAEGYRLQLGMDKVEFRQVDFTLPTSLPPASFDSALSFHTLEHIYPEDLGQFMSNLHFVLKDGAPVLISIPFERNYYDPGHMVFFNESSLRDLFTSHGFAAEEVYSTYEGRSVASADFRDGKILTGIFHKTD